MGHGRSADRVEHCHLEMVMGPDPTLRRRIKPAILADRR